MRPADGIARGEKRVVLIAPAGVPDRAIDRGRYLLPLPSESHEFGAASFHHFGQTVQNQAAGAGGGRPPFCLSGPGSHDGVANVFAGAAGDVGAEVLAVP